MVDAVHVRSILKKMAWVGLGCALFAPQLGRAEGWRNVPVGSRTAAMGGAGAAGGYDSAMPLLNPAGLARVPGSVLSLSASLYQLGVSVIPNFLADGDTIDTSLGTLQVSQPGVQSREFKSFPSSAAYFLHLGSSARPQVLAASFSLPRSVNQRIVQSAELSGAGVAIRTNLTSVNQEEAYRGALSWAIGLGGLGGLGGLRLGASAVLGYTRQVRTSDRSDLVVEGTERFSRLEAKVSRASTSFDLGLVLGAQMDVLEWLRVGLSVRSPSLHLNGSFRGTVDSTRVNADGQVEITAVQERGDTQRGFPLQVVAGLELHGATWAVALDGTVTIPRGAEYKSTGTRIVSNIGSSVDAAPDTERQINATEETKMVVNLAVGAEFELLEDQWLRVGLFTEMSRLQSSADQLAVQPLLTQEGILRLPINRFGGSLGWGTKVGPVDTTLGVWGAFGSGETLRAVPPERFDLRPRAELTGATVYDVIAFLSAAVDLSETAKAVLGDAP